ncbi:hypothetical protein AXW93_03670 [Pseudomonas aeruginosa]|nr:hypothetical protein AXW93_03670 [Pseudomonas aeruginosa]
MHVMPQGVLTNHQAFNGLDEPPTKLIYPWWRSDLDFEDLSIIAKALDQVFQCFGVVDHPLLTAVT